MVHFAQDSGSAFLSLCLDGREALSEGVYHRERFGLDGK